MSKKIGGSPDSGQAADAGLAPRPRRRRTKFGDWQRNLLELGAIGRESGRQIKEYAQCRADTGLYRPEGSPAIREAREYLCREMTGLGLEVTRDYAGNIYGTRPGREPDKAVLTGSHIDTVSGGGQFDGAYGVVAALEVMRRLVKDDYPNRRPVEMVAFMGEEGSAFSQALLGSAALAGAMPREDILRLTAFDGRSFEEIVEAGSPTGLKTIKKDVSDYEYFVEAHIEQGPILWTEKRSIGCVHSIAGLFYLNLTLRGQENHAGSTPMTLRRDPTIPMAEIILFAQKAALEQAARNGCAVATADTLYLYPGAPSIIPGRVEMGFDLRDASMEELRELRDKVRDFALESGRKYGCRVEWSMDMELEPVSLDAQVIEAVNLAAGRLGLETRPIFSGAIHDALNLSAKVKTGMIFVPSRQGLSHSPYEWTDWPELGSGIDVLEHTVRQLCL